MICVFVQELGGSLLLYIFLYSVFTVEIKMFHLNECMSAVFTNSFVLIRILLNSAFLILIVLLL